MTGWPFAEDVEKRTGSITRETPRRSLEDRGCLGMSPGIGGA
jgi:hypothetical protein